MSNFTDTINDEFDLHILLLQENITNLKNELDLCKKVKKIIRGKEKKTEIFVLRSVTIDGIDQTKKLEEYMSLEKK